MADAPERIRAVWCREEWYSEGHTGREPITMKGRHVGYFSTDATGTPYIRADLVDELVKALEEATTDALASLVAAVSLLERGGRRAAPSDKMFAVMLADYNASIERTRAALTGGGDLAAEMRAMLAELRALREQQAQETDAIVTIQGRCADKVHRAVSERRWSDELRPAVV